MGVGKTRTTNQRTILKRIQEMDDLFKSFMMNQATPQLEAWSSLRSNEGSNHHGQPMIGIVLTSEQKASTRMSQYIERIKKALNNKQRHPVMMEH